MCKYGCNLDSIEYFKGMDLSHCFDALTHVLDRMTMISYINWLVEKDRPFSLCLVDIDNFKNVNDTYGHPVGDIVLEQTASYLMNKVGTRGVIARYGGDEFMIVLEGVTEYNDVWACAHEIDMNIGGIEFKGIPNLSITVSMGIARCPVDARSYDTLLNLADKALYRAKTKGRNCFIIFLPEKHANILLNKQIDKSMTSMQFCASLFSNLMAHGEDISKSIMAVFRSFVSSNMYDHICIETRRGMNFSVVHTLARKKNFEHIPYKMLNSIINSIGYARLNNARNLNPEVYKELIKKYEEQEISSVLCCKISAYGRDYGFIRVDTVSTMRIWQNTETSLLMAAASVIGIILHYQNKTLEDLPEIAQEEAGSIE